MQPIEKPGMFYLGKLYDPKMAAKKDEPLLYPSKDLTTHAVCVGMTGSGKTGLGIVFLEEAALQGIPSIIIDPKGDMGNLLLQFPDLSAQAFKPWIDSGEAERKGKSLDSYAEDVAKSWQDGLEAWGEPLKRIQDLKAAISMEIYTPASQAGIPLSILHSFEAPPKELALDADAMRQCVLSTTSSLLGLLGITADPVKSREHILISSILAQSWKDGKNLDIAHLIEQVQKPPFTTIGVLDVDTFFPAKERMALSVNLNNFLAAPGFQTWMEGAPLDIEQLLFTSEKKPKCSIISIAHLNDPERMFFVTLLLNALIAWMRKQSGTSSLRAIFYMDEIAGFFPPVATPPSKAPMMTLLKQARAYGLGMMLCTQNPVDLDYKGLSNCGTWLIGRLQTARDKSRVIEGLSTAANEEMDTKAIDKLMSIAGSRVFIMRSIYEKTPVLFQTRWTLSYLRGPLTLAQIAMLTKKDAAKTERRQAQPLIPIPTPLLPTHLPQYFVSASQDRSPVVYRPFIAGFATLHFVEKKYNVDDWLHVCLVAEMQQGKPQWETAESRSDLKQQLTQSPIENASYQELPSALLNEKITSSFKQDLLSYLYQNNTLKLFEYRGLKVFSTPQESEEDFRQRLKSVLKEQEDREAQALRDAYEKKITALNEKIRKAEGKKTTKEQQSFYQKCVAFLAFLTTLMGAFFSRKLTKTTVNQAGTTLKRMGRMGKDAQDVTQAEETLQVLQQQLQETHQQLEEELAKLHAHDETLTLDEINIRPRKTDMSIDEIALVWWP